MTIHTRTLTPRLRAAVALAAAINFVVGFLFFFGPELRFTLWPTPIPPVLMRFIGAIIIGNGIGAVMIARQGTWDGARVLFAVAMVYGVAVLPGLLYHLLFGGAAPVLWIYVALDALFLLPIAYIFWRYSREE